MHPGAPLTYTLRISLIMLTCRALGGTPGVMLMALRQIGSSLPFSLPFLPILYLSHLQNIPSLVYFLLFCVNSRYSSLIYELPGYDFLFVWE